METMKDGDVFEVIKDWDLDNNPYRRMWYTVATLEQSLLKDRVIPNTFKVGAIGVETQFPFWKYPEYFKKITNEVDKHNTKRPN